MVVLRFLSHTYCRRKANTVLYNCTHVAEVADPRNDASTRPRNNTTRPHDGYRLITIIIIIGNLSRCTIVYHIHDAHDAPGSAIRGIASTAATTFSFPFIIWFTMRSIVSTVDHGHAHRFQLFKSYTRSSPLLFYHIIIVYVFMVVFICLCFLFFIFRSPE
jgi:hypothetical protein